MDSVALTKRRLNYIDIARGIGILLVYQGHNLQRGSVPFELIYSFHMPLFFLVSGLFVSIDTYNFKDYINRKIKTLIYSYIFFSIVQLSLFYFILHSISLKSVVKVILFGWGDNPLWFLPILFLVEILYYAIVKYKVGKLLIFLMYILAVSSAVEKETYIYKLGVIPWYFIFYFVSAYFRNEIKSTFLDYTTQFWIFISLLAGALFFLLFFCGQNIESQLIHSVRSFFIALIGSIFIVTFSKIIEKVFILNRLFIWLGQNTLVILCTHLMIKYTLLTFGNEFVQSSATWQILDWMIMIFLIYFFNKYMPVLVGKAKHPIKINV